VIVGEVLHRMGRGEHESPVVTLGSELDAKSIGHSMTFSRDIYQQDILDAYLLQLAEMVGRRVRNSGFLGRTVSLTVRYADFTTFTRQHSLRDPVQGSLEIYRAAQQILSIHSAAAGNTASGRDPLQPEQTRGADAPLSRRAALAEDNQNH
jgi:DNA polymerase-4